MLLETKVPKKSVDKITIFNKHATQYVIALISPSLSASPPPLRHQQQHE